MDTKIHVIDEQNLQKFEIEFLLKALDDSIAFKIASRNPGDINAFFYAFLGVFPGVLNFETRTIVALTVVTDELRNNLRKFVSEHDANLIGLRGVEAFVRRLANGEQLYVLPQIQLSQQQSIALHNYLAAGGDGETYTRISGQTEDLFKELMEDYTMFVYGQKRKTIGEPEKAKRTCRFCGRSMPDVSFKKKAHAISEALGNKTLVLAEECDDCNQRFATTIEPELIEYFALTRAIYSIKGKGGIKKYEGKNFKIFRDKNLELHYFNDGQQENSDSEKEVDWPKEIVLESARGVAKQNIYRVLVKFALSVIECSYLKHFTNTIKWINGHFDADKLPPVAVFFFDTFIEQPTITLYIRSTDIMTYPFTVCELHFALSKYCFIIPFSNEDNIEFTDNETYQIYFDKFKHYSLLKSHATFIDFSDPVIKPFAMCINFELQNDH